MELLVPLFVQMGVTSASGVYIKFDACSHRDMKIRWRVSELKVVLSKTVNPLIHAQHLPTAVDSVDTSHFHCTICPQLWPHKFRPWSISAGGTPTSVLYTRMMGVMGCIHELNSRMFYSAELGENLFSRRTYFFPVMAVPPGSIVGTF